MRENRLIPILLLFLMACDGDYMPKPKGYNFIDLPEHEYNVFQEEGVPFSFEYSKHAMVLKDTTGFTGKYWKVVDYPDFESKIHLTYYSLDSDSSSLNEMIEDARKLAAKHMVKASGMEEMEFVGKNGSISHIYSIGGEVPSQCQFYSHDNANHFLRGALYFQTAKKNDSLRPVIDYVVKDLNHLLNTLEWGE
jgi:gliding motility-associated lipoprotein GldD